MKRLRGLGGWCSLGIAVAAIGGGAIAGKRYLETKLLSNVLGPGVEAQAIKIHWTHAAGCAEDVKIPLPNATDSNEQALQLYAPKLWFAYDAAALMRKRFILPRVLIEDALIATENHALESAGVTDLDLGPAVDMGDAVEVSAADELASSESTSPTTSVTSTGPSSSDSSKSSTTGRALPWLDDLVDLRAALNSTEYVQGRQVSIDADMISERIQAFFEDKRQQSNRMLTEARDFHQQLMAMDNVLRHGPELIEYSRRTEIAQDALIKLKVEVGHVGKLLDEEQARVRADLLVERKQLEQQSEQVAIQDASGLADAYLSFALADCLHEPKQVMVLLTDLMRKPFRYNEPSRGQSLRHLAGDLPEFAAESTEVRGQLEIAGQSWPFEAKGYFRVLPNQPHAQSVADEPATTEHLHTARHGQSQWQMSIEHSFGNWTLNGTSQIDESVSTIKFISAAATELALDCRIEGKQVACEGSLHLSQWLADTDAASRNVDNFAIQYRNSETLKQMMARALQATDQAPLEMAFHTEQAAGKATQKLNVEAVQWLSEQLARSAAQDLTGSYQQASLNLESLVHQKLNDQKSLVATLRRDAEQHLSSQMEELRRLQTGINNLIEQRHTGNYFARQPGEVAR